MTLTPFSPEQAQRRTELLPFLSSVLTGTYQAAENLMVVDPLAWTVMVNATGARTVHAPSIGDDLTVLLLAPSQEVVEKQLESLYTTAAVGSYASPFRSHAVHIPLTASVRRKWLYSEATCLVGIVETAAVPEDADFRLEARNWAYGKEEGAPGWHDVDPWQVARTGLVVHLNHFTGDSHLCGPWAVTRFALGADGRLLVPSSLAQYVFIHSILDPVLGKEENSRQMASSFATTCTTAVLAALALSLERGASTAQLPSRELRKLLEPLGIPARRMPWTQV